MEFAFLTSSFTLVRLQDAFVAFHVDKVLVSRYLKSLQIGELAPDQPSIEPTKNVSPTWKSDQRQIKGKYSEIRPCSSESV